MASLLFRATRQKGKKKQQKAVGKQKKTAKATMLKMTMRRTLKLIDVETLNVVVVVTID